MIGNADNINDIDGFNCKMFETKVQLEHIFKAINELDSTIFMLTADKKDPNYKINMSIMKEINSLYYLIIDIIEKDIKKIE